MSAVGVQTALPSAWYPDPRNSAVLRWWDGSAWTTHVKEIPPPVAFDFVDDHPVHQPLASDFIITTRAPEIDRGPAVVSTRTRQEQPRVEPRTGPQLTPPRPVVAEPLAATVSPAHPGASRISPMEQQRAALRNSGDINDEIGNGELKLAPSAASSVEIWVLGALPVVAFFANFAVFHYTEWFQRTPILFWIIPAAAILLGFVLATTDRGRLVGAGVTDGPHAALGLLPPIYLLMRAVQVSAITAVPFLIWGAAALLLYRPVQVLMGHYLQLLGIVPA